jgi:hypothetical protein
MLLDAARKSLPNLNRDTLSGMLPEGPGKNKLLDLVEATFKQWLFILNSAVQAE